MVTGDTERTHRGDGQHLAVAVPDLRRHSQGSGIGRVLGELQAILHDDVAFINAPIQRPNVPFIRGFVGKVVSPKGCNLLMMPMLTGCQLRNTSRLPRIAMVYDVGIVDCEQDRYETDLIGRVHVLRSLRSLKRMDLVITPSRFSRNRILHYLPALQEDRVRAIHLGVSERFLTCLASRETARARMKDITGATLRSPLLIYVGSERPRKNLQLLFNTLKHLKDRYPAIQLLKIGRAGNARLRETTLRQLRDCGLQMGNDVIITDYVSERDLALAYRSANLFVTPSLYEGFCLPALEALACATPVVCTNREWAMEVVNRAGWLAKPEPEAFCEAIGDVLGSAETPRRVIRGLARAHELSWERTGSNFLCAFETVFQHSTVNGGDSASVALGA